jgi:hypothetical protein
MRPRLQSGACARPLNFTVRRVVQRPQETLRQLCGIFPLFGAWWDKEEDAPPPEDRLVDGVYYEWTHHAVLRQFLLYFSMNHQSFTQQQVQQFGAWVDDATWRTLSQRASLNTRARSRSIASWLHIYQQMPNDTSNNRWRGPGYTCGWAPPARGNCAPASPLRLLRPAPQLHR